MKNYKMCQRCVMDNTSDTTIEFDNRGYCSYCESALNRMKNEYFPNEDGIIKLHGIIDNIKKNRKRKKYDCVIGLSGGLDSSYLVYLAFIWGLKVLVLHVDDGFDTEISKNNIRKIISKTEFDLITITPDKVQFYSLTKAYMYANVPNLAAPQDNILFAVLYKMVKKYKIKYYLSGDNFSLESILQQDSTHTPHDLVNLKDIHKKFGTNKINKLNFISPFRSLVYKYLYRIKTIKPLNYIDYNRKTSFKELETFCDYQYYGGKHLENVLTAFIQLYWFPKKFNVDKRKSHLSSMIVSNQISRAEALVLLNDPLYDEELMRDYLSLILNKLDITNEEFEIIMNMTPKKHTDFKTQNDTITMKFILFLQKIRKR